MMLDRQDFLKTLAEACQKTGFEIHAYCLMRNHALDLKEMPKTHPEKVAMAGRLRRETTLTIREIAQ
jgi:REP element-mobilizing transposase RayT